MRQGLQAYLSLPLRYVGEETNVERLIRCPGRREAEMDGRGFALNRPACD
jgi:hypothetical protein